MEDIGLIKSHKISINDTGDLTFYLLHKEKFGINVGNRNIYVYKKPYLELIEIFKLYNFDIKDELLLVKSQEKNEKFKFYFGNEKKLLFLS